MSAYGWKDADLIKMMKVEADSLHPTVREIGNYARFGMDTGFKSVYVLDWCKLAELAEEAAIVVVAPEFRKPTLTSHTNYSPRVILILLQLGFV